MAITFGITRGQLIETTKRDLATAEAMAQKAYINGDLQNYGAWMHDIGLALGQLLILETTAYLGNTGRAE